MKFGFQTICWDERVRKEDWPDLFRSIKAAGFDGVEIFQSPDLLPEWPNLQQHSKDAGVTILGLTGGTLKRRMNYLRGDYGKAENSDPYLYTEGWRGEIPDAEAGSAFDRGFRLALHYHHLKHLNSGEEAEALLAKHPSLHWMPDTAHLFIGRQNTEVLLQRLKKNLRRTIAVHLKDWTKIYGRFSHQYARGFCVLGKGEVGIERVIMGLQEVGYQGWCVVELDWASANADSDMWACAEQLHKWGVKGFRKPERKPSGVTLADIRDESYFPAWLLAKATAGESTFYSDLADYLRRVCGASTCAIFLPSGAIDGATAQAWVDKDHINLGAEDLNRFAELADLCIAERAMTLSTGDSSLVAVPVMNRYNPNHVRMVLIFRGEVRELSKGVLSATADALDVFVTQLSLVASARAANCLAGQERTRKQYLDEIARILRDSLNCEGVTVFVKDPERNALVEGGSTGLRWLPDYSRLSQKQYELGGGRLGRIARERGYRIEHPDDWGGGGRADEPRSYEDVDSPSHDSCMIASFFDGRDELAGVVRCRNKKTKMEGPEKGSSIICFSEEDLTVVEAVMGVVQPPLEVLEEQRRLSDAVTLLAHECENPLFALRGGLGAMELALGAGRAIRADRLSDMSSWVDLMGRQVKHFQIFVDSRHSGWIPRRSTVLFFGDLVAPVVGQARMLLRERGFSAGGIDYGILDEWLRCPPLWVDRTMFEQVIFNLLSNAIKYAKRDPNLFRLRISAEKQQQGVKLLFEDQGLGVPAGWEEDIFLQHVRVESDDRMQASGHGIGLWVVNKVVLVHGGRVYLDRQRPNTTFVIDLPSSCIASGSKQPGSPIS